MYKMKKYYILGIIIFYNIISNAQESVIYNQDYFSEYLLADDLFRGTLYGPSKTTFESFLIKDKRPQFSNINRLTTNARLDQVISSLRMGEEDAESKIKEYIVKEYNKPASIPAILEFASYCYNEGDYNEAIAYYDMISDPTTLSEMEMSELAFKKGYSYFINKKFTEASQEFKVAKELRNTYFYNINYYYGMSQYFQNNYDVAIESFKRASGSKTYESQIPYYISQIYFAQKKYDNLIIYAEDKIKDKSIENIKDIRLLLGQTYYIKQDYYKAIDHLEYYEANTDKLTAEEFYQLAFTQYKLNKCEKSIKSFKELTGLDNKMGQMSNYYLADCLIKTGDKNTAKSALKRVMSMPYEGNMKEEATFNYAKLSAELSNDREAINILVDFTDKSIYYKESQDIINDLLVNSGDYENSIKIIESLPKLSDRIKSTYQMLAIKNSALLLAEENSKLAEVYIDKSMTYPLDRTYNAQAHYYKAQLRYNEGKYEKSLKHLEYYFEQANGISDLPEESSQYLAHYLQGYNKLKLKQYKKAGVDFKNAIVGINLQREKIKNDAILSRLLPDAFIRTGDCLFKEKEYTEAKKFYDQAISRRQGGYIYALYQRGLIEGLIGENEAKAKTMTEIISKHAGSEYADDAYMQLGDLYLSSGNLDKASIYFMDLMNNFGNKSEYYLSAHLKLGLINFNLGNYDNALYYYNKVLASKPNVDEQKQALAAVQEIYVDKRLNPDGYLNYLDSMGFKPEGLSRDSLAYHLALSLFDNAEYPKAVESFTSYLTKYPSGFYATDAKYNRAESNNVLKAYESSFNDYESIINQGSNKYYNRSIYKAALIAYNYTLNFDKAFKYYQMNEALAQDQGEKFQAQLGALRSAFKLSKDNEVIAYGKKVAESLNATTTERASAYYYMGKSYYKLNDLVSSSASFNQVERYINNSQAAEARYMLAEILFKQGKITEAQKAAESANEKNNSYSFWIAKGLLLLSETYIIENDFLNARAAIEAVIDNFKDDPSINALAKEKLEEIKKKEAANNRIKQNSNSLEVITPKKN
jgi:tetratricopeptide (TPR) repeat protein